ncbi:MAG: DUF983 domain-containing protein [Candidatus Promineifilaceae bacterium]
MDHQPKRSNLIHAILVGRCPRCRQGPVFATFWRTHEDCSVCNLVYEREAGFFLMSIFFAYLLDGAILFPIGIAMFRADVPVLTNILVGLAVLIIVTPFSYRYSRILWLHVDWMLDPRHKEEEET